MERWDMMVKKEGERERGRGELLVLEVKGYYVAAERGRGQRVIQGIPH